MSTRMHGVRIFPVTGLFFLASVLVIYFVLTRLRFGRYLYAIGGNEETSKLSGIAVVSSYSVIWATFSISRKCRAWNKIL